MPVSNEFELRDPSEIIVNREERQRKIITTGDLEDSIARNGVLHPIVVTRELVLIAGERRLTACQKLGIKVPIRYYDTLSSVEAERVQLEENLKRKSLDWRDEVRAISRIHEIFKQENESWTETQTGEGIGVSVSTVCRNLRVAPDLDSQKIASATTADAAYNILVRKDNRKLDHMMGVLLEAGRASEESEPELKLEPLVGTPAPVVISKPTPPPLPESILNVSFLEWAPSYDGPKFDLVHCDFPYGLNVFAGQQMARAVTTYADGKDVYWTLLKSLCENLDRVMAYYGHIVFWFSMQHYSQTVRFFKQNASELEINPYPLIWIKSDNVGICPDPAKYQRQVYETALVLTRNGRKMVKVVSNAYSCPTDKALHPSCKPEPMLRYFFGGMVDAHTSMLDPTCGSGSALRAAESLDAKNVLGLEIDKDHTENAKAALRKFRGLRRINK